MFSYSSLIPSKSRGTIRITGRIRLGPITDVDGKMWDVKAIVGKKVCACPMDELHPYYTDTSNTQYSRVINQTWESYEVEIVKQ